MPRSIPSKCASLCAVNVAVYTHLDDKGLGTLTNIFALTQGKSIPATVYLKQFGYDKIGLLIVYSVPEL